MNNVAVMTKLQFVQRSRISVLLAPFSRFFDVIFSASKANREGGLLGLALKRAKNNRHIIVRTQFCQKSVFRMTLRSYSGSSLSNPAANMPGMILPSNPPAVAPTATTAVALAFSSALNQFMIIILNPFSMIGPP